MYNTLHYLVESVDLRNHPLTNDTARNKGSYYLALSYIVQKTVADHQIEIAADTKEYISKRLELYCEKLRTDIKTANNENKSIETIARRVRRYCRAKQRLWLMCDLALILLDKSLIQAAATIFKQFLPHKSQADIDILVDGLLNDSPVYSRYPQAENQIRQYLMNQSFFSKPEIRIIVTANMSAGKSTLINALIGKHVARTSQEVCTGSVCYLYNKAFEDGNIHLSTNTLTLNATGQELQNYQWSGAISMASFFTRLVPTLSRICLIDTPGVNAALYKQHAKQTRDALLRQNYDTVIYVISPTNLGTDAERKHLLWVAENIPHDKVIFVLNKLDNYRSCSDSIEESIQKLGEDLNAMGFENPTICPVSAYFGYLLKLKISGQELSDDEKDEYAFFAKKFMRSSYDLSQYYTGCAITDNDTEELVLSKRCGLYGLENIIYRNLACGGIGMKKIFIKYNPYNLETELTVDGKKLAQNSKIGEKILPGSRLQEWVEDLPQDLIEEYNDTDFDIVFHGTLLDFEDLTEVFTQAYEQGKLTAKLDRIPAKETSDKEALIDTVFKEIQEGPFDDLRDPEIINAFQQAKSSDFEVCVVATMSAGKSTLINSMLGTKLMPSKQEACTAIITRIKDTEGTAAWQAEVYSKDGRLIETHQDLTYATMERLNSDENVSVIKVAGNIPFVTAEEVSLVLIDTPGPNNARDPAHKKVQSEFLNKSSKSLVLYIMEGTFGSDDDNALLQRVADSMKVGGKQSKDRFIFVVNKMDDRRKEDGDTSQTLERVRAYLRKHGIINPNLFPAAALPALNIRLIQNGVEVDEDTLDETEMKVRKLNRNASLHFEEFAPLPASIRGEIKMQLADAKNRGDANAEALIHTGVVSIEAAIRQYVQKYAKTAKIKNIVDTFMHKIAELGCEQKTLNQLAKNREDGERIARQIATIRQKIDDAKAAKKFKDAVDDAVVKVSDDANDVIVGIVQKYQTRLTEKIDSLKGDELDMSEVDQEVARLVRFAQKLEPDFKADLDELIRENLVKTSNVLLDQYKDKLASLTDEIDPATLSGISIEPLKMMASSVVAMDDSSVKKLVREKRVKDGEEWVKNTKKKWYKPWTWFQEDGHYRTKYKKVEYVPADDLAQTFFAPVQDHLFEDGEAARQYAIKQSNRIAAAFSEEFKRLDNVLKHKLEQLESYATDSELAQQRIEETEKNLKWLENITEKVTSILEI